MKGGLCFICTSLLTIFVLSSCVLFLLVVPETLNDEGNIGVVDASGLHNVSQRVQDEPNNVGNGQRPSDDKIARTEPSEPNQNLQDHEMTFADAVALNSVTTDGLPDTGQPPILISLADNAKLDLKNTEELLYVNESEQVNETQNFVLVDDSPDSDDAKKKETTREVETLVVKAKPMQEARLSEESFKSQPSTQDEVLESQSPDEEEEVENIPAKPETPHEDIPSFSEWAQKQLAEAEKKDTVLNHSTQPSHSNTNFSSKNTKLRSKNYASPACGAKIVAANPEAGSASSILSPNRDEYMLNSCNSRIWFIVELCEPVQAQKIEIANFELFSSTPKDIAVYFSDRFPTREWASVGQFAAKDMRDVQSFDLYPHLFGKFIKVEMLSHHGSEHYCPVSLFKVYGTSEFEVLEKESSQHAAHIDDDDEDDEIILDVPDVPTAETESKNLFGSARDAVMSIMKKAAQVLVKSEQVPKNATSERNDTSTHVAYQRCCSPSHIIVCDNCSETLFNEVYELISCSSDRLTNLVRQVFLRDTLKCTGICQSFGLDFKSTKTIGFSEERVAYVNALFPQKYLAALCNILAIKEKKVVLNTSFETEMNVTSNITNGDSTQTMNDEPNIQETTLEPIKDNSSSEDNVIKELEEEATPDPIEQKLENNVVTEDTKNDNIELQKEINQIEEKISEKPEEIETKTIEPEVKVNENEKTDSEIKDSGKADKAEINNEKQKEGLNLGDEATEQILIENDNFLSDFEQLTTDPTPAAGTPAQNNQNQGQPLQKESVFLRLSNRVKTLERNMSLSGQYLEELSRRYKKQVEEMQKSFEKTVVQMTDERRKSNEREQKYLEQMTTMQEQLAQMTSSIKTLTDDKESWFGSLTFTKFLVYQSIIFGLLFYYMRTRRRPEPLILPIPKKIKKKDKEKFRRKSVEGVSGHATPSIKKRRPSEEALRIARKSTEEMNGDDDDGEWQVAKKNRRRKTSILHRNMEAEKMWYRQDSIGKLQENPIPLDDEEYIAPVSEPQQFDVKKELPKPNGSIFNNLKAKTIKTRRLSSPAFLRTFSRQSSRSNPSPVVRNLEPILNGVAEKTASESPTSSLWSESTEISQTNGYQEGSRKKKKGLKNIFKKVF